jgi:hypothetical protein
MIKSRPTNTTNNSIYWSSRSAQHVSDKYLPTIRSVRLQITACGMVSCWVRKAAAWYIVSRCCPPDRQPTTITGHHKTCCNLQFYAPDDGQMFVRNMLSWSWRSINTVMCCISWSWFYYIAYIEDARSNTNQTDMIFCWVHCKKCILPRDPAIQWCILLICMYILNANTFFSL